MELAEFNFDIEHIPGSQNIAADTLSQIETITAPSLEMGNIRQHHEQFGHPGIIQLNKLCQASEQTLRIPNMIKKCTEVVWNCQICAERKPRWLKASDRPSRVVEFTEPWQRISIDYMVNKPQSRTGYNNILTVVDKFSCFPFTFPTKDRTTSMVIKCLRSLFNIFRPPCVGTF